MTEEKDFMTNDNESKLHRLGIRPGMPDSQSNTLPVELKGRLNVDCFQRFHLIPLQVQLSTVNHGFLLYSLSFWV
jgi:hypothetical protein